MPRLELDLHVPRPRAEVLAWWTGFPDDYRAQDPREQPHRITVVRRHDHTRELHTYWRLPGGVETIIPETLTLQPDGNFTIDVHFPLGLEQRDTFTLRDEAGGTGVHIVLELRGRHVLGRALTPLYWQFYGRAMYPRLFRQAAALCARDAPRLG